MTRMIISKYVKDYEKRWVNDANKLILVESVITGLNKYIAPISGNAPLEMVPSKEMSEFLVNLTDKIPRMRIVGLDNYIIKNEFRQNPNRRAMGGLLIAYLYSVDLFLQSRNNETAKGNKLLIHAENGLKKTTLLIQSTLRYPEELYEELLNAH